MQHGADLLGPLGFMGPPKPRCVTFIRARLMFGDITPAEGSLSAPPAANISAFTRRALLSEPASVL